MLASLKFEYVCTIVACINHMIGSSQGGGRVYVCAFACAYTCVCVCVCVCAGKGVCLLRV